MTKTFTDHVKEEFSKLVPFKELTGPELAAIILANERWLAQKQSEYDDKAKTANSTTEVTVYRILAETVGNLAKESTV
jgi:hypothetical protein